MVFKWIGSTNSDILITACSISCLSMRDLWEFPQFAVIFYTHICRQRNRQILSRTDTRKAGPNGLYVYSHSLPQAELSRALTLILIAFSLTWTSNIHIYFSQRKCTLSCFSTVQSSAGEGKGGREKNGGKFPLTEKNNPLIPFLFLWRKSEPTRGPNQPGTTTTSSP